MLHIAICEKSGEKTTQSLIRLIETEHDITLHDFDDVSGLKGSMTGGESFELFLLDRRAFTQFLTAQKKETERFFLVKTRDGMYKIPFSMIVYVTRDRRSIIIYTEDGREFHSTSIRVSFTGAVESLMDDERFLLARKTCLVNMDKIQGLSGRQAILKDGRIIDVPRYAIATARRKYAAYLTGL